MGMIVGFIFINMVHVQIPAVGHILLAALLALPLISSLDLFTEASPPTDSCAAAPGQVLWRLNRLSFFSPVVAWGIFSPVTIFANPLHGLTTTAGTKRGIPIRLIDGLAWAAISSFRVRSALVAVPLQKITYMGRSATEGDSGFRVGRVITGWQESPVVLAGRNFCGPIEQSIYLAALVSSHFHLVTPKDVSDCAVAASKDDANLFCGWQVPNLIRGIVQAANFRFLLLGKSIVAHKTIVPYV